MKRFYAEIGDKVVTRLTSLGKTRKGFARRAGDRQRDEDDVDHDSSDRKRKLAEKWAEKDMIALLTQIGVMKPLCAAIGRAVTSDR